MALHESLVPSTTPGEARFESPRDVFCEIVEQKKPAIRIFETDSALVIMDLHGGYPLVLSKEHSNRSIPQILELAGKMVDPVRNAYHADGVRVILNDGAAAGQEIPHPHVHVMPRNRVEHGVGRTIVTKTEGEKRRIAKRLRALCEDLVPKNYKK